MSPSSDKRWPYTRRSSATREYTTPTPKGPWRGSPTKEIQLSPSLRGCPSLAWWPWDFPSTSSEDKKQKKETGQLSPYRRNRASPRSGRRRASSVPTGGAEPLQEVEGDGPAQSLQAEPSLSKKWKETGQLSPYRRNRTSPRSGRRRASSVPRGGNRASPRSGRRRASSVPTGGTEPLQKVEGDGPAQSLQAEPNLSKKWKETGQLSSYRRNRASPRSGRRRASSVPTRGTEPLQEVEGDGPAHSLQAEPSLSKKWKKTGQLSP